jgi:hypothetical protein
VDAKGTINLNNFGLDTSGLFGGPIRIRGDRLEMNDSRISSHTFGALDGQSIDIQVNHLLMQDSDIIANTYGAGNGSAINLQVHGDLVATRENRPLGVEFGVKLNGGNHISTSTVGFGDIGASGDINILTDNIHFSRSTIHTYSFSPARSGNISLRITDTLKAIDIIPLNGEILPIFMAGHESGVYSHSYANGSSGHVDVIAQHIILEKGGTIATGTFGSGQGGSTTVEADTILVKGQGDVLALGVPSVIASVNLGTSQSGQLKVNARQITLENGGQIATTSLLSAEASELTVIATDTLTISGVAKFPYYSPVLLEETFFPSSINSASINLSAIGGPASNVYVQAKHIHLTDGGIISSLTYGG